MKSTAKGSWQLLTGRQRKPPPVRKGSVEMTDFKNMYFKLFDQVTRAANILQWALLEGEEAYIDSDDPSIIQLFKNEDERRGDQL